MNNITIFFSDGVPNDVTPNGGYNNSTLINIEEKTWIYTIGIGNDSTGTGILKEISYSTHSKFYHWVDIDPVTILRDINSRINSNIAFIDVNKTTHPSSGSNGTVVNFTINVTNTGNATFDPVIVTDTLPEGLDYFNSSDKCELSGDNVTWNLGQLVESESRLVYLEAKINSSKSGNLTNNVTVTGVTLSDDNVTANYSDNVTVINASISVNKTAHPSSGSNGTVVNFTINVTNTGNATLNPVMVTDSLPEGLDYVNSTGLLDTSSNNVTWNLGSLSKPEHKLVYLEARINRSESGVLTNLVLVEGKPKSGYNVTDDNSTIVTVVDASISVNKTSNISSGSNGTVVNFTINVTNTGNATLNPVILTDTLPEGLDYVSSTDEGNNSSNNVTWNLRSLNKSDHKLVYLEAKINRSESSVLTNLVLVEGKPESGYNVTHDSSTTVTVVDASISVNKTSKISSGSYGTLVNFTINVTNTGNATFDPVIVTDTLPEGLDYFNSSDKCELSGDKVTWNLSQLVESGFRVIYFEARINSSKSGNLTNNVTVTGVTLSDDNVTANDSDNVTVINASISVNKTAHPSSGSNGTLVNFTINVTNTGNATFDPVMVTDSLPEGLDYVNSTGLLDTSSNNVTWNLGKLKESEFRAVYLEARINRSESGVLTNLVLVEGKPESGYNATDNDSEDLLMNYTSVVFALDTSGSMRKYYLLAPNEGAEIVSGWAGFGNATVSIVSWDHNSEIIFGPAPLVGSEGRLAEVLESLSEICIETDLTIYDQGLKGALAALRDEATFSDGSSKIIIFLAGYSEFKPGARLDDYISEADRSGIRIFTIGMGINESLNASEKQHHNLTKISHGTRGEFYSITAFSPQELKLVMEEIAHKL
ncbi:VWA domain-containing protein [Methanotrichaceae archaeon M04Ac]|uniref:VWA domain-containing protein n=1 Tax=Candidatus Methanocrinis alkalitolerans TaxID=3033395 RepID=A0ABT5XE23_9EURY|nr:VWA domain-containing protein [Candidatus Methanocrinis alkalitolerans]MDF0592965.1 VWA domain-containing protein [Candidatus Methanocrinis alkalitolerans]